MNTINHARQFAVLCCLCLVAAFVSAGGDTGKPFKHTANEEKIFELTNAERKKEDVATLKLNAELSKIARAHSENMARQGKMAHDLDDKTPFDRMRGAGFLYTYAGENVAKGTNVTLPAIMDGWMKSEGHRKNILKTEFSDIGVGIARAANGDVYFTQLFAKPRQK